MSNSSYRTILRSSSIVGGAQVINIAVGLVKMKAVAVLLGPTGVGLLGLYLYLVQTAATVVSLGFASVGTRQIAAAQAEGGEAAVGRTRRALFWGTLTLSLIGAALFWALSEWIAQVFLNDPTRACDLAWLSLAVALTVAAASQSALLTGLRRVGDLARISVLSGLMSAAVGVGALWLWGTHGLLALVLVAPVATFLLGHFYVVRLGPPVGPPLQVRELAREWAVMARLGSAFMMSGLVTVMGFLLTRTLVQRDLGTDALGQFQAAWAIGMTYMGFILGAMGTDYYPRLTAAMRDRAAAVRLVNEQTEVALLLCAPVLVTMLGCAPYVIRLLYSAEFGPAVDILRWQLPGDLLKVLSWPLGYVIVASGAGKTFVLTESLAIGVFVLCVWIGMPILGVTAVGVAFLALYMAHLPLVWWFGRRRIGFRWSGAVKTQALVALGAVLVVEAAAYQSDAVGGMAGILMGGALGMLALFRLSSRTAASGTIGRIVAEGRRVKIWKMPRS